MKKKMAPAKMKKAPTKMMKKSPSKRALKGDQDTLPPNLQKAIKAATGTNEKNESFSYDYEKNRNET